MQTSRLRKALLLGGALLVVVVLAGGGIVLRAAKNGDNYLRKTLPLMPWNFDVLRQNLNKDLFSDADVKHIALLGPKVLGALTGTKINRPTFTSKTMNGMTYPAMAYGVIAQFEKGNSGFIARVANIDGRWQFVEFDVSNPKDMGKNLFKPFPSHPLHRTPQIKRSFGRSLQTPSAPPSSQP